MNKVVYKKHVCFAGYRTLTFPWEIKLPEYV